MAKTWKRLLELLTEDHIPRSEEQEFRQRLLNKLYLPVALFGGVPASIGTHTAFEQNQPHYAIGYALLYLAFVLSWLPSLGLSVTTKVTIACVCGTLFAAVVLSRTGLNGVGLVLMIAVVVFASALGGVRGGWLAVAINLLVLGGVGWMTTGGGALATSWLSSAILFLMVSAIIIIAPQLLFIRLETVLAAKEEQSRDLSRANAQLQEEIQQRKSAENARRESEQRFSAVATLLPETIFETAPDGTFTYVNATAYEKFGYGPEDLANGHTPLDMLVPEDHGRAMAHIGRVIAGEKLGVQEYTAKHRNGNRFPVLVNSTPIVRDGEVVGLRGLLVDISTLKKLEAQVRQGEKMQALGTLAGGIAHDFNNLLMGIQGHASLMSAKLPDGDPNEVHLRATTELVKTGAGLTRQLLGVVSGTELEMKPVDICEMVGRALDLFEHTHRNLLIHREFCDEPCIADVEASQIDQVLLNLFVNAAEAMPDGGQMDVSTTIVTIDETAAKMEGIRQGKYVSIEVRDNGVGMDEEVKRRIFEPFFTTREKGRGTGLGLASAYGITRNHGGGLRVESEAGGGSKFEVLLPVSHQAVVAEAPAIEGPPDGSETILVVDDEEIILTVLEPLLKGFGYTPILAPSGSEAIRLVEQHLGAIDLVLLDLVMPGTSATQICEALWKLVPDLRILISSGYSEEQEATKLQAKGCVGFIQKPYDGTALATKVRSVLEPSKSQTFCEC